MLRCASKISINRFLRIFSIGIIISFYSILFSEQSTFALEFCPFRGNVNFLNKTIDLLLGEKNKSSVGIKLAMISDNSYKLNLDLENIKTSVLEISTQLESSIDFVESADKKSHFLQGQISSRYSLFNHKPVEELAGTFQIKNHTLLLSSGKLGSININGFIELLYPYKLSLLMQIDSMSMTDFLSMWADTPDMHAKGEVSRTIQAIGALNRLNLKGSLSSTPSETSPCGAWRRRHAAILRARWLAWPSTDGRNNRRKF